MKTCECCGRNVLALVCEWCVRSVSVTMDGREIVRMGAHELNLLALLLRSEKMPKRRMPKVLTTAVTREQAEREARALSNFHHARVIYTQVRKSPPLFHVHRAQKAR